MMLTISPRRSMGRVASALAAVVLLATSAAAQDPLVEARSLYAAASYEEALATLGATSSAEAQQYRALCLLALGRTLDAERALEALITSAPNFAISDEDVPPRFIAMFSRVRQTVLPVLIRRMFTEGREQFQGKNHDRAKDLFERVVALSTDPALATSPEAADMQMLSSGFLDLMTAAVPPPPAQPSPRAAAPPAASAPARIEPPPPVSIVPPVPVRQVVPPWPAASGGRSDIRGELKLLIGKDGRVKNVEIVTSLDPKYDLELLAAARLWRYKPATLRGEPVEIENIVAVQIGTER